MSDQEEEHPPATGMFGEKQGGERSRGRRTRSAGGEAGRGEKQVGERSRVSSRRSEEYTSELQSLEEISYAVFCLKKQTICDVHPLHAIALTM